jgi:diguanylate cyclase (GGDEF)-like protein
VYHWSAHQLTEYFAAVSSQEDELSAITIAAERAAEVLDAEVSAVIVDGETRGSIGFGSDVSVEPMLDVVHGAAQLPVPGLGDLEAAFGALGSDRGEALIVGRLDDPFGPEERQMLQGMAQGLGLALRSIRTLAAERTLRWEREREAEERLRLLDSLQVRQRLLETLLAIQRAVSHRRPLSEILDSVTEGAAGLLDDAAVYLLLATPGDSRLVVASTHGVVTADGAGQVTADAASAMAADRVMVRPGLGPRPGIVVAAPVHIGDEIAGSLVATLDDDDAGVTAERSELLSAFAQQVSLALTDARTVEAVQDAYLDDLTGLPNRALFLERLRQAVEAAPGDRLNSVLFIDLDRFKAVNDSMGHKAGDDLLADVAERIRGCTRPDDVEARIGGDEFAVLLEQSGVEDALPVAERIIAAVKRPFRLVGMDVFINASIGVASISGSITDPEELLSNADVAMYRAKDAGPGRVVVFEKRMRTEVVDRLSLHADLQYAIERDELALQFQPLVDLRSGRPVGVEALVRWRHGVRGLVPPMEFIPIAEETGLIIEIGRWVLRESVARLALLRRTFPELGLNVNISGHQLADRSLAADVSDVLRQAGLPSGVVTLELTESAFMKDPVDALRCLRNLRALGVRLAVDDFGTGYSSLSYLQRLPIDEVKIDRMFVAAAETTAEGPAIVRAIVDLGHTLRLRTVAEGIESDAQLQILRGLGCDVGQGYYLARPMDPEALPNYLIGHGATSVTNQLDVTARALTT